MNTPRQEIHKSIFFYTLILLVISLPFSLYMVSISEIILVINWIVEGGIFSKVKTVWRRKSLLLFLCIYFIHLIGLLYSTDFNYAFHDLRIKLPLLLLPLIIGTSTTLNIYKLKTIILFFSLSVFAGSLVGFVLLLEIFPVQIIDSRQLSMFISHIRFSLMINLSIFTLFYFISNNFFKNKKVKLVLYLINIWLVLFLFILKSFTGVIIFIVLVILYTIANIVRIEHKKTKNIIISSLCLFILFCFIYLGSAIKRYYTIDTIDTNHLKRLTVNSNLYSHNTDRKDIENGHFVWIYVCSKELRNEWNKKSSYSYDSSDIRGQRIEDTLIRYLTSKGLRKDSLGFSQLTNEDIKLIEKGFSNHIFDKRFSLYPRLYQIIWELDHYQKNKFPIGHSLTQRIEYLKIAFIIIKNNFWFGVGTGDVQHEFHNQYQNSGSILPLDKQYRSHNQYVTFIVSFGIIGFILIVFCFIYPVFYEKKTTDLLFLIFFFIGFLSFLNEDTLETHIGVSFFSIFFALLLFQNSLLKNDN